jgi:hypothetical protein
MARFFSGLLVVISTTGNYEGYAIQILINDGEWAFH